MQAPEGWGPKTPSGICCRALCRRNISPAGSLSSRGGFPSTVHTETQARSRWFFHLLGERELGRGFKKIRFPKHTLLSERPFRGRARLAASAAVLRERISKDLAVPHSSHLSCLPWRPSPRMGRERVKGLQWGQGKLLQQGELFCLGLFPVKIGGFSSRLTPAPNTYQTVC